MNRVAFFYYPIIILFIPIFEGEWENRYDDVIEIRSD